MITIRTIRDIRRLREESLLQEEPKQPEERELEKVGALLEEIRKERASQKK